VTSNRFLGRLHTHFRDRPDRLFAELWLRERRHRISFGDLAARTSNYAQALRAAGVKPGDVVFVVLRHGPELAPAFLAAMWIGAVPSFLPPPSVKQNSQLYWQTHAKVFTRTQARALVVEADLAREIVERGLASGSMSVVTPETVNTLMPIPLDAPAQVSEDAPALLQHSSGTTGLKKGIVLSYRAIVDQLESYAPRVHLTHNSAIASWLPLYHDMGLVACFLMPLYLGIPTFSLDPFAWVTSPLTLFEAIEAGEATHVWLPNFAFAHLARTVPPNAHFRLSSIVALTGCSEPNRPDTFDKFLRRFAPLGLDATKLQTCYAMAETVFAVSQSTLGIPPRRLSVCVDKSMVVCSEGPGSQSLLTNGRPLPGVSIAILSDGLLTTSERIAGEICIASPFNFRGYFAGVSQDIMIDGYFRTGDLGFLDSGEVFIFGRSKDVAIINGRNFHAHDIEAVVGEVEGVKKGRCVALGIESATNGSEELVIVAEADTCSEAPTPAAINRALLASLGIPAHRIEIVSAGWLCKTTSGKVARGANKLKYLSQFGTSGTADG